MEHSLSPQNILQRMPAKVAHFRLAARMRALRKRPRLLVVEDQEFSRRLLSEVLRANHDIDAAASVHEGLNLYFENAPDLVFLDIELPDESGHTLARLLRALDPESYIIMVTANNSVDDVSFARANHVDGFIIKPYNKQKIQEAVEKFAARRLRETTEGKKP
ncbi:MAG: response regulator [Alphaproteobacteria bacterium]|nr:response regulator [Alphaproteobacteria bacterium]